MADGMNLEDIMIVLSRFKLQHAEEYFLRSIGVFGSFARGEARPGSDIDIVFESDRPNLFRTARMRAELEELLAAPVDIVRLRERMNPNLREAILREAKYA